MFDDIETDRVLSMTSQEKRLFNNVKKAFYASDEAVAEGKAADRCLEELFKAIDAAKNLAQAAPHKGTTANQGSIFNEAKDLIGR